MNRLVIVGVVAMFLTACGSAVKLNDVPVVDKAGTSVNSGDAQSGAKSNGTAQTSVTPVEIQKSGNDSSVQAIARVVYFDFDSFVIRPEFQSVIEAQAKVLRADKSRKVVIEGHTDERGGREYNLALGQKRAEAVRSALKLLGVADGQVEAVSFGKEKPAALGGTEEAMAKNRRAEFSYR